MSHPLCLLLLITAPLSWASTPTLKPLVRKEGKAPMALIIGVNTYKDPGISPLRGAVKDAQNMFALLTEPQGYGFPADNVVLLTDADATRHNVLKLFQKALIDRAQAGDPVVIFFSGHGSQGPDLNDDEPDDSDEILMLHDTTNFALGLWDDELNRLLLQLYQKTTHITVILDACHSESATRTGAQVRGVKQTLFHDKPKPQNQQAKQDSDGGLGMVSVDRTYKPASMPELVVITAAKDGTSSYDGPEGGMFSRKLIPALGRMSQTALTYSQVEREVRLALDHTRLQLPQFQGQLERPVFGMPERKRPLTWAVQAINTSEGKQRVELLGTVMPGMSVGAMLRLYPADTIGKDWLNPSKAHGELVVTAVDGLKVWADLVPTSSALQQTDLAVLVLPGEQAVRLNVHLRAADEAEGLPKALREQLEQAWREDPEAVLSLKALTQQDGDVADMELVYRNGALVLLDGLAAERGRFATSDTYWPWTAMQTLIRHARIKAILAMAGDDGELSEHQRLQIDVVAAANPSAAAERYRTKSKAGELLMPKGKDWYVRVTLTEAKEPMYVAGFALSADGTIFPLPVQGSAILLKGGESHIFKDQRLRYQEGTGAEDHLVFFASSQKLDWKKLGEGLDERRQARGAGAENALFQRLNRFLTPGQRTNQATALEGNTRFSRTAVRLKVE